MSFIQPAWLALILLGIPIILLHMRRRQTVVVGSIRIWQAVTGRASTRPSRRLPPLSLPLLLQLLAVLLTALALAQPVIGSAAQSADHTIFILDNSGLMQFTDGFAPAREYLLAGLGRQGSARYSLLLTSGDEKLLMARAAAGMQQNWLAGLPDSALPAAADWPAAVSLATGLIQSDENTRIVLLTTASESRPAVLLAEIPAEVEELHFGAAGANPYLQRTRLSAADTAGEWTLDGRLGLPADPPDTVSLSLWFRALSAADYLLWDEVELPVNRLKQQDGEYAFSVPLRLPRSGVLRVELAGAAGFLSSASHVVYAEPVEARVLFVGQQDPALFRALAAIPHTAVFTGDASLAASGNFDLVISNGVPLPPTAQFNSLSFLPPAGADAVTAPLITWWAPAHPLSAGVAWNSLEVTQTVGTTLLDGAEVILESNGVPLVQARTTSSGRHVTVAFSPSGSNWPQLTGFPAFISNVLHWVMPELGSRTPLACESGRSCNIASGQLPLVQYFEYEDGTRLELTEAGSGILDQVIPAATGVLWPQFVDGRVGRPIAVNAAPLPPLPAEAGEAAAESTAVTPRQLQALWFPLLVLLLLVLLLEAWLAFAPGRRMRVTGPALRRRRQAAVLRTTSLLLLVGALAGLQLPVPGSKEQLVVLLDPVRTDGDQAGDQVGAAQRSELHAQLEAAGKDLRSGQMLAVIEAGSMPVILRDLEGKAWQPPVEGPGQGANLEDALATALALLDPDTAGRIILASDGLQAQGDVRQLLSRLTRQQTVIDVQPLAAVPAGEVWVERLLAPEQIYAHDRFTLHATVRSESTTNALVTLLRNDEVLVQQEQQLRPGRNIIELLVTEEEAGEVLFEVQIRAEGDTYVQNNRDGLFVQVLPAARILVVTNQEEWGGIFADALRLQGLDAVVVAPNRAPYYLADWLEYSGYVLLDVPAIDLQPLQQDLLEAAVGEHGRGLLILGGANTFGPGGYLETPLERISPLSSHVPRDAPDAALLFVLDRSGSMQQRAGDGSRLDIARQATMTAVELLDEKTRVSIVVFDSEASVLVPMQDQLDLVEIEEALRFLEPGGGTVLYPALVEALDQFDGVDAASRHIVVMSDGLSQPGDFEGILGLITDEGITVSTVAIGDGADTTSLQRYARMGGGAFHASRDFRALPGILAQESLMLSGAPIEEYETWPRWNDASQVFMQGLPADIPAITGFVLTTAKDEAAVHMEVPDEAGEYYPLLASWRFGNGQVLAFTSQGTGPWTSDWLQQPDYPLLWSQVLRAFLPAAQQGSNFEVHRVGDELHLSAEVLDREGQRLGGLDVTAGDVQLREMDSGTYQGVLPALDPGAHLLELAADDETLQRQFQIGYPARYNFSLADSATLELLARAGSGQVRQGGEGLFVGGQNYWSHWPAWPLLVLLALLVFFLELLLRHVPGLFRKELRA